MDKTLLDKLEKYCPESIAMHMPGHKRNANLAPFLAKLGADVDITEIDGFDNLHSPEGILLESMEAARRLYGSRRTFYDVNGSTGGILAAVTACARDGGKIIAARNCHKAVYNAITINRLEPVYLMPEIFPVGINGEITPQSVEKALRENEDVCAIIITSPTYEGVVSDVNSIADIAHKHNVPLIVDEAHGAHFGFGHGFPDSAIHQGADIIIQSLHKTMLGLTQTALVHVCGDMVDENEVQHQLSVFQTSSPSYLLMVSIDGSVKLMADKGEEIFSAWEKRLDKFYSECRVLKNLYLFDCDNRDRSKLVIVTNRFGISGNELMNRLREYNIELEMASIDYAIAMTGPGDRSENMDAFLNALLEIDAALTSCGGEGIKFTCHIPQKVMNPWQTQGKAEERLALNESFGRVSLEYVWAYPPGIPILVPGERIDEEAIDLICEYQRAGIELKSTRGLENNKIFVLKM